MAEGERFEIILTESSLLRFRDEVNPYLIKNFSAERVLEISEQIFEKIDTLEFLPFRSSFEQSLMDEEGNHTRFLLFRSGGKFELKILFLINEQSKQVYITDFFPTRMNPSKMKK